MDFYKKKCQKHGMKTLAMAIRNIKKYMQNIAFDTCRHTAQNNQSRCGYLTFHISSICIYYTIKIYSW